MTNKLFSGLAIAIVMGFAAPAHGQLLNYQTQLQNYPSVNTTAPLGGGGTLSSSIAVALNPCAALQILQTNPGAAGWQCINLSFSNLAGSLSFGETPLTTLGDLLTVNSTPALARVAGNATTATQFLSQTGTGSVSAAPQWASITLANIGGGTAPPSQTYNFNSGTIRNAALVSPNLTTPQINGTTITNAPVTAFSGFIAATTGTANIAIFNSTEASTVQTVQGVCQVTSVSCSTFPVLTVTDGAHSTTCAWTNNNDPNCSNIGLAVNQGKLTMKISTAASGCTDTPANCNIVIGLTF